MAILLIALSVSSVFMTINLTISVGRLSLLAAQIVILKIATLLVESFCNYIKTERSKCSYLLDELRKKIKNGELPPSEFWKES